MNKELQYKLPFGELLDRLTVDQIKEVLIPDHAESVAQEMQAISHDLDLLIEQRDVKLTGRMARLIIAVAQMNLHIWHAKDRMQDDPSDENYATNLKFAHQLNGVRNRIKNLLMEEAGDREKSAVRTNSETEDLEGWNISL